MARLAPTSPFRTFLAKYASPGFSTSRAWPFRISRSMSRSFTSSMSDTSVSMYSSRTGKWSLCMTCSCVDKTVGVQNGQTITLQEIGSLHKHFCSLNNCQQFQLCQLPCQPVIIVVKCSAVDGLQISTIFELTMVWIPCIT